MKRADMRSFVIFSVISDDPIDQSFATSLSLVSEERRQRIEKFRFDIDKKLSLYAELIVRRQACQTLSIRNAEIAFERNEYGKPYIKSYPGFHFPCNTCSPYCAPFLFLLSFFIPLRQTCKKPICRTILKSFYHAFH